MRAWRLLFPAIAGLMLALTYFLLQAATPDAGLHERTLGALRSLALSDAALQRDVLRARTGLLRNYDPLVRSLESLREAAAALRSTGHIADGPALADIERRVEDIAAAVRSQEVLVEDLKSRNALLQNSLGYFSHTIGHIRGGSDVQRSRVAAETGQLANLMLAFVQDPGSDAARRVAQAIDRLQQMDVTGELQAITRALTSHGRLIVSTLPEVDDLVARLQVASITDRSRALLDTYLRLHGLASARADAFRILLYAVSVALAAYVAHLFLRLRAKTRSLQVRLDLENMIAGISSRFIDLGRDRIEDGIRNGLARVAQHTGVERAYITVQRDEAGIESGYHWIRPGVPKPRRPEDLHALAMRWDLPDYERHGCVHVGSVRSLPDGSEKTCLRENDVRSWLCVPMWLAGRQVASLNLDTVSIDKHWAINDIALLRTVGEIFANAIARERHEAEREALKLRLDQAQRLEALGTLAGGIAHEFNNILGAILGYGEMALTELRKQGPAQRYVQHVMTAGHRAQAIIDQILTFGRRSERQHRPLRVEAIVTEAVDLLRGSLPATVTLQPRLEAGGGMVAGDPTQLQQVVINLCTNAAHAMGARGVIDIGVDMVDLTRERALSHGCLPAGRYVRLAVSDAGRGMDAGVMARIFEPFFTTKAPGEGTGLGLPTVHGIVAQHGGAFHVQSQSGAGSTFEAYFPRAEAFAASEDGPANDPAPRGHGETILIVDDEKPLVLLGEETLAALGYEPVGFDSSTAALAAFRADPRRFDLVLTDEVMSGMTGMEFAVAVHEVRPELPIILMTGHSSAVHASRLEAMGIREVIKKPLLSAHLANSVAKQFAGHQRARS